MALPIKLTEDALSTDAIAQPYTVEDTFLSLPREIQQEVTHSLKIISQIADLVLSCSLLSWCLSTRYNNHKPVVT
jgi:hypothetical protein